ncbi:MAG: hypothetical protein LBU62_05425 [Bacteroidales bacterium]|nr:hypothetical protein [Bacteroidales bacterium]
MGGIFITAGHRPAAEASLPAVGRTHEHYCLKGASLACGYENQALRA